MFPISLSVLGQIALLIFVYVNLVFLIALFKADNSIMDVAWGLGFILIALYSLIRNDNFTLLPMLTTSMVLIWGGRLSLHIYLRNRSKPEDFRYRNWRESWGKNFVLRSYLQVFMLQGFLMILFSLPVIVINVQGSNGFSTIAGIGFLVWVFGIFWEAIADCQLRRFKSKPENSGKIMTSGLWRYSRHPNYFGESVVWWGFWLMALHVSAGWITIISPVLLTFFLLRISGVPMLEKKYKDDSAYQEYQQRTNMFIPGPPTSDTD